MRLMISASDAISMAKSEQLEPHEKVAYDMIISIVDDDIKNFFDGKSVEIIIDGRIVNRPLPSSANQLIGFHGKQNQPIDKIKFHLDTMVPKKWRADIIERKWKSEYISGGWLIEEKLLFNPRMSEKYKKYIFTPDPIHIRDGKINEIFENE